MSYFIIHFFTMCNYARHAKNDNKTIYISCTPSVDLYSRLKLGNTFSFKTSAETGPQVFKLNCSYNKIVWIV